MEAPFLATAIAAIDRVTQFGLTPEQRFSDAPIYSQSKTSIFCDHGDNLI